MTRVPGERVEKSADLLPAALIRPPPRTLAVPSTEVNEHMFDVVGPAKRYGRRRGG